VELLASVAGSEQGKIISVKLGPLSSASKAEHKAASRKNSGRSFDLCVVAAYLRHSKNVEAADDRFSRNLNVALAKMLDNGSTVGNSINFAIKASISSILGAKNSDPLLLDLTNKLKTLNEASSVSFPVQNGHDVLFTTFSEAQFLERKDHVSYLGKLSTILMNFIQSPTHQIAPLVPGRQGREWKFREMFKKYAAPMYLNHQILSKEGRAMILHVMFGVKYQRADHAGLWEAALNGMITPLNYVASKSTAVEPHLLSSYYGLAAYATNAQLESRIKDRACVAWSLFFGVREDSECANLQWELGG